MYSDIFLGVSWEFGMGCVNILSSSGECDLGGRSVSQSVIPSVGSSVYSTEDKCAEI